MVARRFQKAVYFLVLAFSIAAVLDQLQRPKTERTWHGAVLGVPYDFRSPGFRACDLLFNADDSRVLTPRAFGVGWDINVYGLVQFALRAKHNSDAEPSTEKDERAVTAIRWLH
jgi:hypothetical protein